MQVIRKRQQSDKSKSPAASLASPWVATATTQRRAIYAVAVAALCRSGQRRLRLGIVQATAWLCPRLARPFPSLTIFVLKICYFVTNVGEIVGKYSK